MANQTFMLKDENSNKKTDALRTLIENGNCFTDVTVRIYSPHDRESHQFLEYFYPWEKPFIRTNDFEKFSSCTTKTNLFFDNAKQLEEYANIFSSNDDDRPPLSEELFFDAGHESMFDDVMTRTGFTPRLTHLQCSLLCDLSPYILGLAEDTPDNVKRIIEKRLDLLRGFCKELKRKRYARSYRRYVEIRRNKTSLQNEAMELMVKEMFDKNLCRDFYYGASEPTECTKLLEARRQAVKRKYLLYATDARFRRAYQNRIYFNANKDVPVGLHLPVPNKTQIIELFRNSVRMRGGEGSPAIGRTSNPAETAAMLPMNRHTKFESPEGKMIVDVNYIRMPKSRKLTTSNYLDAGLSAQNDSDIPTSEAELMPQFGSKFSRRMRGRRTRLLKSLHRLLLVESMNLGTPSEIGQRLCAIELTAKGLLKTNGDAAQRALRAERTKAVKAKFNRFANDPDYRKIYLARLHSIKFNKDPHKSNVEKNIIHETQLLHSGTPSIQSQSRSSSTTSLRVVAMVPTATDTSDEDNDDAKEFESDQVNREEEGTHLFVNHILSSNDDGTVSPMTSASNNEEEEDHHLLYRLVNMNKKNIRYEDMTINSTQIEDASSSDEKYPGVSDEEADTDKEDVTAEEDSGNTEINDDEKLPTDDEDVPTSATDDEDVATPATDDEDVPTEATDEEVEPTASTDDEDVAASATDNEDVQTEDTDDEDVATAATDDEDVATAATDDEVGTTANTDDEDVATTATDDELEATAKTDDEDVSAAIDDKVEVDRRPLQEITLNPATLQPHKTPKKVRQERMERLLALYFHALKNNPSVLTNWLPYDSTPGAAPKQSTVQQETNITSIQSIQSIQSNQSNQLIKSTQSVQSIQSIQIVIDDNINEDIDPSVSEQASAQPAAKNIDREFSVTIEDITDESATEAPSKPATPKSDKSPYIEVTEEIIETVEETLNIQATFRSPRAGSTRQTVASDNEIQDATTRSLSTADDSFDKFIGGHMGKKSINNSAQISEDDSFGMFGVADPKHSSPVEVQSEDNSFERFRYEATQIDESHETTMYTANDMMETWKHSVCYMDLSTAESSFDDEIATSEEEYIDEGAFAVPAFVGDFMPPYSKRKLRLFIEMAKIDMSMRNECELDEYFKVLKQLEKIRIYQAHLVKRRRKMATFRLLRLLEEESDDRISNPNVLDEKLHYRELIDKRLYKRKSYYCDNEPGDYTDLLYKRLSAIASKYGHYKLVGTSERYERLKHMLFGLKDTVDLLKLNSDKK